MQFDKFWHTCIPIKLAPQLRSCSFVIPSSYHFSQLFPDNHWSVYSPCWLICIYYIFRITHYVFLFVWVLVFSTVILKLINAVYINSISFFVVECWVVNVPLYGYTIIHSPIDGNLSCFQFLAIKNKIALDIDVEVFLCT